MLRVNNEQIARKYAELPDEELLALGRGGELTPEARLALKTELLKRGHTGLDWIDATAPSAGSVPEGMGGLLLVFCAFVGAVYPALGAWGAYASWSALSAGPFPPLVAGLLWARLLFGVLVLGLGPGAVLLLRRGEARGIPLARGALYLALLGVMAELLTLGPTLGGDQARALLGEAGWYYSAHAVVAGGWLIYLNHSRRVRALCSPGEGA